MLGRCLGGGRGSGVAVAPTGGDVSTPLGTPGWARGAMGTSSCCPLPKGTRSPGLWAGTGFCCCPLLCPSPGGTGTGGMLSPASAEQGHHAGCSSGFARFLLMEKRVQSRAPAPQLAGLRRCLVSQPRHGFQPILQDKQGKKQKGGSEQREAPGMCRCGSPARRLHNPRAPTATGTRSAPHRGSLSTSLRHRPSRRAVPCRVVAGGLSCPVAFVLLGRVSHQRSAPAPACWRAAGRGDAAPGRVGPSARSSWGLLVLFHSAPAGYFVVAWLLSGGFVSRVLRASVSP